MTSPRVTLTVLALCLTLPGLSSSTAAQEAMQHEHPDAPRSTSLTIHTADRSLTLSLADLQALPQTTLTVVNAHTKQTESYSGPLISDILNKLGITLSEHTQRGILDSYILATGTDGYFVIFSGAELQPGLHKSQAIVAVAQSGQPLVHTGAFQLIDPTDLKPARWVRNLKSLAVIPVTPPTQ